MSTQGAPRPFTDDDIATLSRDDITLTEMSALIGRPYGSVAVQRSRLIQAGLIAPRRKTKRWAGHEDALALNRSLTASEVAEMTGRTVSAIRQRRMRLAEDKRWTEARRG